MTVVIDVDILQRGVRRAGALPRVGSASEQLRVPASSVLEVAGLTQVALIQTTGVAGSVRGRCRHEHATDSDHTRRQDGCDLPLERAAHRVLLD